METTLESSGDAAVLSEENGFSEPANHLAGDVKPHSMVNGLSNGYDKEKKDKERHKDRDKHDKDKYREKDKHKDSERDKHRSKDGDKDKHREKDKQKDHKDRDREKEKHRDKDKERDKDKDKEREKNREKDKERDKDRDKSKHSSSSSSKDKHSSSSSSSKDKDKERKDKDREKEKSKHHDDKERKDKEHKSSSSSSKDKEHKSSSSSKHSSSSSSKPSSESSSKDKESKDKEKERDKEKDKNRDREKDKERSKDKHSSSSSKDKDRHSSDKHKSDKDREKDKHSSSSSKDKDRHSSDKKDKHRDKDREKERSKDKEKEKSKEKEKGKDKSAEGSDLLETSQIKSEPAEVKEEFTESFSFQTSIKEESMDLDDDDGKLMIKEEATDDESKMESSFDTSAVKNESSIKQEEEDDDDDVPMAARMAKIKREIESDDEDDVPLIARKKPKKESSAKKRKKEESDYEDDEEDFKPAKKKKQQQVKKEKKPTKGKQETSITESPKKKKKKEEEEQEVWKWWEEEKKPDGVKWTFLEHKGPVFAPPYEPLPPNVKFYYDGEEMKLSEPAEEVATFYARMLDHDYTTKEAFNKNFMHDWRKTMTRSEQETITSLKKCNFKHMHAYFIKLSEERKAMSKEEKKAIKEKNEELAKEYGFCTIDGHKEKIGNFKIEPPGLFRGRGEHPKMGKLKQRVVAEDIIINCSKGSKVPPPPPGHKWKEVRHDNTVTWLASWTENVQGQVKYIMLNPSSKLKGEKDWQKYETARKLAKSIDKIREDYTADWKSKEMKIRQRAVAMYFIDKLALRAGNEKDEDQADTVGCCSLRVEHIQLFEEKDGKENVVVFDFLGKDSIRYYNEVPVERRVFKNLMLFMENKKPQDDLFDRLNTAVLNKHLSDLMDGLTAKVFRTYNASWTLQAQLKELTDPDSTVAEKLLAYNRANRAVAILCNHQRAVPKTHDKSMANLREKLANKRAAVEEAEKNFKHAKRDAKNGSAKERIAADKAKKTLERLREQLLKLELQETDKEENKCIALGTSKLNYLDPRISVAWCKKYDVPIEKIYNKTQRDKFRWAIDMATADYVF